MSDLISRQAAIDVIRTTAAEGMLADTIELRLNELPSAEKTGRWIEPNGWKDWTPTRCSLCGHDFVEYVEGYEWETTGDLPNYCPNCGARMECEEE